MSTPSYPGQYHQQGVGGAVPPAYMGATEKPPPYNPAYSNPANHPYPPNPHAIGFQQVPTPQQQAPLPQAHQYAPSAAQPQVVLVNQPAMMTNQITMLGPRPARITCPSCHASVSTRVTYKSNMKTHIVALILCLFLCWPCAPVPYCMSSCKSAHHYCPNCGAFLGGHEN